MTEKELATLKRKTLEQMAQDRQKLLVRFPFTGGFLMRLELVAVRDKRLRTAATDGGRVFMDIAFCARLGAEERLFVMAHEAWHCVLMHMLRCQTRLPKTFNVATDMEVNRLLRQEGLEVPPWVLMPKRGWEELSAEEIYERLKKSKEPPMGWVGAEGGELERGGKAASGGKDGDNGNGQDGVSGQFDRHIHGGEAGMTEKGADGSGGGEAPVCDEWGEVGFDEDYSPSIPEGLADTIRERVVAVAQQVQRTRGVLPSHVQGVVQALLKPQIRWQEVLARFVTTCYGGSRRWLPPSRRHVSSGLYLQSARQERLRAVVAVDTSGSTTGDLPRFFTELQGLLGTFGGYELTVIQCDAKVQSVEMFDEGRPLPPNREWRAQGFGGTDFRPPFEWVARHSEVEPSCLLYLTDGCGPAPERPPPFPVLWVLTSDGRPPAEWGGVVWLARE